MQRILKYTSSLILCMLVYSSLAQKEKKLPPVNTAPFFNGVIVQADVASIAGSIFSNGTTYSYEASAQADFKHKLLPVIELGYAGANKLSTENIGFKTNAPFGRIGIDLNLLTPKKDARPTSNLFIVGLRLGMTNFKYNISNIIITDDYWGGTQPISYNNISTTKVWYEIVAGVKVEVLKNVFMGWTVRSKSLLSNDAAGNISPWFIPGFGTNNGNNYEISYTIGYRFQLPANVKQAHSSKKTDSVTK
ncbi:MAG: DUF6048 family protein [Paludibacter sp.]|nr:DUF6048 family protein [Paludibacter sp.]